VELLPLGPGVIVLECYYHYPRGRSNLYYLDADLHEVWRAERPSRSDVYSGAISNKGGLLQAYSYDGWDCELDPVSGLLVRKVFSK
jgi:hypothetical protein